MRNPRMSRVGAASNAYTNDRCLTAPTGVQRRARRHPCGRAARRSGLVRGTSGDRAGKIVRVPVFGVVAADTPSAAYAALRGKGRLLELPVFRPDVHYGSVYLGFARQSPCERRGTRSTERPQGYSMHRALYARSGFFAADCPDRAEAMLRARGRRLLARDGQIATSTR